MTTTAMEDTKIYELVMDIFEEEHKWFCEEVYIEECYANKELQDELDKCIYHGQQIDFADKHWSKIKESLYGSRWETAYEALNELRDFLPRSYVTINGKRISSGI